MLNLASYGCSSRLNRDRSFVLVTASLLICLLVCVILAALSYKTDEDSFDVNFAQFWDNRTSLHGSAIYPTEFFANVSPIACHSHNDYARRTPLFAALGAGCVSVEADIWLKNGDLYVGHKRPNLRKNMTLQNMYIDPLIRILEVTNSPLASSRNLCNPSGVFYEDPEQTFTLLVDFKSSGPDVWTLLLEQLRPLRDAGWLAYWNGTTRINRPITIVASGAADFDMITANDTYRDVFYDAPIDKLEDDSDGQVNEGHTPSSNDSTTNNVELFKYNPTNSHFASARLSKAVGPDMFIMYSRQDVAKLRRQIHNARDRQLLSRYWGTGNSPRRLRNAIWALLMREEVSLLNVDDLTAANKNKYAIRHEAGL